MEFSDIFEEWDAYAQRKQLKGRHFEFSSAVENADKKIVAITGVRRCGKSSLLMLIRQRLATEGKKALYVNVEDSRISHQGDILDEILKWFGDNGFLYTDVFEGKIFNKRERIEFHREQTAPKQFTWRYKAFAR